MKNLLFPILIALALFSYCIFALWREAQRVRRHTLRVKKLYASPIFEELLPYLAMAKKRPVEQITIDKTGVLFIFLSPVGSQSAFMMKQHGYAYLTLEQQHAMGTLLEECLPKLRDNDRYRHSCRRITLVNGDVDHIFRYTMQNSYKSMLNRAAYYETNRPEPARLR